MIYRTVFQSNLIEEYLDLVYNRYILTQPGILGDYYNIDTNESVYDDTLKATYNRPGNVDLTGIKFNVYRNLMLPFGTRTQRTDSDSQNFGYNNYETRFQIFMPSIYGIEPNPNDYVVFRPNPKDELKVFLVEGIERSTLGQQLNHVGYMLTLKPFYVKVDDLEANVINQYVFDPTTMSMQDPDTYNFHIKGMIVLDKLLRHLNKFYNLSYLDYVDSQGNSYSEFRSILYVLRNSLSSRYKDIAFPYTTYFNQSFIDTFNSFLQDYDIHKLQLSNVTISDDVKQASSLDDILTLVSDSNRLQSLNTLETFILLYKSYKLIKEAF